MNLIPVKTPDDIPSRGRGKWDLDVFCWKKLCSEFQPKSILELGTGRGLFLSSVMPLLPDSIAVTVNAPLGQKTGGKFTTFDIPGDEIGEFFRGQDYASRIEQVWSLTKDMMSKLEGRSFDFIHIDASHSKDEVVRDSKNAKELLNPGGVIVWHDVHPGIPEPWINEVYEALEELQTNGIIGDVNWFLRSWVAFARF